MSQLTYGHFHRTGIQDCGNAFSPGDFDMRTGTATEIVDRGMVDWHEDKAAWIQSWEGCFESLDPEVCWSEWLSGWREKAIDYVTHWLAERAAEGCAWCGYVGPHACDRPARHVLAKDHSVPVLYSFGVMWDRNLSEVK